jgi:hypothetical protein
MIKISVGYLIFRIEKRVALAQNLVNCTIFWVAFFGFGLSIGKEIKS